MITRIRELLESKELSPTQFADLIGIGRPVVSHILSERNKPSLDVVQRIVEAFPEISLPWLLKGTGDMLVEPPAPLPTPENDSVASVAESIPAVAPIAETTVAASVAAIPTPQTSPAESPPLAAPTLAATRTEAAPASMSTASPAATAAKPFRAPRFVPAAAKPAKASKAAASSTASSPTPPTIAQPTAPLPVPAPAAEVPRPVEVAPPAPAEVATPAAVLPPADAAMLPFLAEPGKAIRRIVIFYRDGSFADYQPEG